MCCIKTGKEVRTSGDLQNLITSAILRQIGFFDEKKIKEYTSERLMGSKFENHSETIDKFIKKSLIILSQDDTVLHYDVGYKIQDLVAF